MDSLLAIFLTIFGTATSVGGVVIYVFNGTKKLIREMHQTQKEIKDLMVRMDERTAKMDERAAKMDERAEERHREALALITRKV